MVDAQGRKFLMTPLDSKDDPAVIHLTSEKAEALTYFTGKDNLTTKSINQAIVDNGCPTNVAGKPWVKLYAESRGIKKFNTKKCSKVFKFGPSLTYEADEKVIIPAKIGSKASCGLGSSQMAAECYATPGPWSFSLTLLTERETSGGLIVQGEMKRI